MKGDIAAIVDVDPVQIAPCDQCGKHIICDGARHRRHRRHEGVPVRPNSSHHAPRHSAGVERPRRANRRAQARQFSHKFIKDRGEAHAGLAIGLHDFCFVTLCQGNDIDGTVIEMQPPAIGQQRNLRAAGHSPVPTGQGLASFQASTRMLLPCPGNLSSPTMALTWPPSAA